MTRIYAYAATHDELIRYIPYTREWHTAPAGSGFIATFTPRGSDLRGLLAADPAVKLLPHPLNPAQVGSAAATILAQYGVVATDTAYSALKKVGGTFDPEG